MADGIALSDLAKKVAKGIQKGKITPQSILASTAIDMSKRVSVETFGYDFPSLVIKLGFFFLTGLLISKFMEAVIFTRGIFVLVANTLGFNVPSSDQVPESLKKLFSDGYYGFKFWDIIKILAIILVIWEYFNYSRTQKSTNGKISPLTTGIFVLIITLLGLVTVPELINKLKSVDFNLESMK